MIIGSPLHGIFIPGPADVPPIDPLTVAGALRVMYYVVQPPFGPQKSDVLQGDPAASGDEVISVADQLIIPVYPALSEPRDVNNSIPPTMRGDGLEFSADGTDSLSIANVPLQTGAFTSWTAYIWGKYNAGSTFIPLANNSTGALVGIIGGIALIDDDGFSQVAQGVDNTSGGKILFRFSYDGVSGNFDLRSTGATPVIGNAGAGVTCSFNYVGQSPTQSLSNDSTVNRYLGELIYNNVIPVGSADDLGIRSAIKAGAFNTGGGGYHL